VVEYITMSGSTAKREKEKQKRERQPKYLKTLTSQLSLLTDDKQT
jgi:hypothetical protein